MKTIGILILLFICITQSNFLYANDDIKVMLEKGREAIENGRYEEAVNCVGEILTASGNKSTDPKVTALGAVVQAYGILQMGGSEMKPTAKKYIEQAIVNDPDWKFPKELLKKAE